MKARNLAIALVVLATTACGDSDISGPDLSYMPNPSGYVPGEMIVTQDTDACPFRLVRMEWDQHLNWEVIVEARNGAGEFVEVARTRNAKATWYSPEDGDATLRIRYTESPSWLYGHVTLACS